MDKLLYLIKWIQKALELQLGKYSVVYIISETSDSPNNAYWKVHLYKYFIFVQCMLSDN